MILSAPRCLTQTVDIILIATLCWKPLIASPPPQIGRGGTRGGRAKFTPRHHDRQSAFLTGKSLKFCHFLSLDLPVWLETLIKELRKKLFIIVVTMY